MKDIVLPCDAQDLVPHRPPMRFVDRLLQVTPDSAVVKAVIMPDNPLIMEEETDGVIVIELMAQACAAAQGYHDRREGKGVRKGFLVGLKNLTISEAPHAGETVFVKVRTVASLGGFILTEATVTGEGERRLASGTLKLWVEQE